MRLVAAVVELGSLRFKMLAFFRNLFRGERASDERVRRWTKQEPNRVRRFEETTQTSSCTGDGFYVSIRTTHELATSRQVEFLQKLGYSADGLTKGEASTLLDRILRPVDYALRQTFKQVYEKIDKEHLRVIQVTMVGWDYCSQLPRFGPQSTWADLEAGGVDPHRALTKEEKIAVTEIAFRLLPPEVFLALKSNGIQKYKTGLDDKINARI
jgi:hypothetical protein